ncbi:MAG: Hsp20/alpha crystallin family protein [Firmicutes bacterium]|nr:Hsp20/alpha crystallin family protein [Bacillota bacterium]
MFNLAPFRFREFEESLLPDFFSPRFYLDGVKTFKTDIAELDKEYVVEAELPGYAKDNISVEFAGNELTIKVKKAEVAEEAKGNYLRKERRTGEMARTFVFEDANEEGIKAEFKDGILKINLPKKETAENKTRKIEIH